MSNGICPFAIWSPSPNFEQGREGNAVAAVVLHVCEGGYQPSVDWLRNPTAQASAHFVIAKDGRISQLVNIFDTAWGNGLSWNGSNWVNPQGHIVHPAWAMIAPPTNPNARTISIEHEGQSGEGWTAEMDAANTRLLQWIATLTGLHYEPEWSLIGHSHLDEADRAQCPGPSVDYPRIARAGNLPFLAGSYRPTTYVNVRQGPSVSTSKIGQVTAAMTVQVDTAVIGAPVYGSDVWLHLRNGGFVFSGLLQRI